MQKMPRRLYYTLLFLICGALLTAAEKKVIKVSIEGEVRSAGHYTLPVGSKVGAAIVAAGGLEGTADYLRITVMRRSDKDASIVSISAPVSLSGKDRRIPEVELQEGDLVKVPRKDSKPPVQSVRTDSALTKD